MNSINPFDYSRYNKNPFDNSTAKMADINYLLSLINNNNLNNLFLLKN